MSERLILCHFGNVKTASVTPSWVTLSIGIVSGVELLWTIWFQNQAVGVFSMVWVWPQYLFHNTEESSLKAWFQQEMPGTGKTPSLLCMFAVNADVVIVLLVHCYFSSQSLIHCPFLTQRDGGRGVAYK